MKQGVKFHVPFSYSISTYHCLYHPDTMKGIIHVQAATPGGNPTAGNTTSSSSAMPKSTTSPPPTTTTGPKY